MKVVAYLAGVPGSGKNSHKTQILQEFIQGVNAAGDIGIANSERKLIDADVGVIQGWVHAGSPNTPHLMLRSNVSKNTHNKHTIIIDSNLFNYEVGKTHPMHYSRYSMDGVFPTTGNYFKDNVDPARWKQISNDLGLTLKDWRTKGNHILICTQRNGGWSMDGVNVVEWVTESIKKIKTYTDRPIVVRGHPGDKKAHQYLSKIKDVTISNKEKLTQDLKDTWACITYNSSPGVASAIEGIPVFVTDPNPKISQAYEVANTDISFIENPNIFDRQSWVESLAMSHWKRQELINGSAWKHIRNYV